MCPSPPLPSTDAISVYWDDKEIFMTLEKIERGSSLPGNVIPVNPCRYKPSDLPADVWYFIRSGIQKEVDTGLWKITGEASIIFESPVITGWRTSYKYYEDQDPNACKTDWVMQEYQITKEMNGKICPKDTGCLCRVFLSDAQGPSIDRQKNLIGQQNPVDGDIFASYLSELLGEENISNGEGSSRSRSNEYNRDDENSLVPVTGGLLNRPVENLPDFDGDYLELLDLENPARSSSSSENSSCLSKNSDDYFDSLALRDLEPQVDSDQQQKSADCKFSILASIKPNEVVMHPGTAGPLLANGNRDKAPSRTLKIGDGPPGSSTEQNSQSGTAGRKVENDKGGSSSNPHKGESSYGGHRATIIKRGAASKKTKILKYLCFMLD